MSLLRTDVVRRAENRTGRGNVRGSHDVFGQSKIDQRKRAVVAQHDIPRFEIAVKDADFVYRGQGARNLTGIVDGLLRRYRLTHARAKISRRKVLHGDVG